MSSTSQRSARQGGGERTTSSSRRPTATPSTGRPRDSSSREAAHSLSTPTGPTGILDSVTVAAIFEAARADGVAARYELVPVEDLYTADGLWLVSSGRGPALVTVLDGRPLRADPDLTTRIARYADFGPHRYAALG